MLCEKALLFIIIVFKGPCHCGFNFSRQHWKKCNYNSLDQVFSIFFIKNELKQKSSNFKFLIKFSTKTFGGQKII
jgi:hypothetical protein